MSHWLQWPHRLIASLIHWLIDSLIHWFSDSLTLWFIDSLLHCFSGSYLKSFENPRKWANNLKEIRFQGGLSRPAPEKKMEYSAKQCTENPSKIICKSWKIGKILKEIRFRGDSPGQRLRQKNWVFCKTVYEKSI